jgi:hypothetical protein
MSLKDKEAHNAYMREWRKTPEAKKKARDRYQNNVNGAKDKRLIQEAKYKAENPEKILWKTAKMRAKKQGVPFDITIEDIGKIPSTCPVLGIPMIIGKGVGSQSDNSPTLDKYIPSLGYTKGNVFIISRKANQIKSSATTDEVSLLLKWMQTQDAMSSNIKEDT